MGMSDLQFTSFRRRELGDYEELLLIAVRTDADEQLIAKLERMKAIAQKDIEEIEKKMDEDKFLAKEIERAIMADGLNTIRFRS